MLLQLEEFAEMKQIWLSDTFPIAFSEDRRKRLSFPDQSGLGLLRYWKRSNVELYEAGLVPLINLHFMLTNFLQFHDFLPGRRAGARHLLPPAFRPQR